MMAIVLVAIVLVMVWVLVLAEDLSRMDDPPVMLGPERRSTHYDE